MNSPDRPATDTGPLLAIDGLAVEFALEAGTVAVVSDLTFSLERGATLAVVGESGCGKSVTALAIMGLLSRPGRIAAGSIRLDGQQLVGLPEADYRALRGGRIGMVFQEPMSSLNPVFTVGDQIAEVLRHHRGLDQRAARAAALRLLERVRLPSPRQRLDSYPHELSGGMKQRVMIAIALACGPALLIADEPTTALDVTVQAQIMALLAELRAEFGMAVLLITHNLGLVAQFADRVAVLYAGQLAELAPVERLFRDPLHPYTRALLGSLPRRGRRGRPLATIAGTVPSPHDFPGGCRFATRCPEALTRCMSEVPPEVTAHPTHRVGCWLHAAAEAAR